MWKAQKDFFQRLGIFFLHFSASRNLLQLIIKEEILFISRTHQQRTLWDSFNTGELSLSFAFLCCCLLTGAFFFMIHLDFPQFFSSHFFSFHLIWFLFLLCYAMMTLLTPAHDCDINTPCVAFQCIFLTSRDIFLRNQLHFWVNRSSHWSTLRMYVGTSKALLRNKQHSEHNKTREFSIAAVHTVLAYACEEAKKYIYTNILVFN